jgi:NTE family protein
MIIENVIFKGGGVKGIAYAGCIKALEEKNSIKTIKRCAGTSVGSIAAVLLSIGCNDTEITEILENLNFKILKTGFNPFRILTKYGFYTGDKFVKWLESILKTKNLNVNLTFHDLHQLSLNYTEIKNPFIFAVSLNTQTVQEFSYIKTPDVRITDAVRASISIPFYFKTWKIKQFPGELFVDGGVSYNYPISVFDNIDFLSDDDKIDDDYINERTLGFYIGDINKEPKNNKLKYFQFFKYINSLLSTIIDNEIINFIRRKDDVKRTIFIPDFGVSAVDFNISKEKFDELYKSGYDSTIEYLKKAGN